MTITDDLILSAALTAAEKTPHIKITDIYRELGIMPAKFGRNPCLTRVRISAVIRRAGFVKVNNRQYVYSGAAA